MTTWQTALRQPRSTKVSLGKTGDTSATPKSGSGWRVPRRVRSPAGASRELRLLAPLATAKTGLFTASEHAPVLGRMRRRLQVPCAARDLARKML